MKWYICYPIDEHPFYAQKWVAGKRGGRISSLNNLGPALGQEGPPAEFFLMQIELTCYRVSLDAPFCQIEVFSFHPFPSPSSNFKVFFGPRPKLRWSRWVGLRCIPDVLSSQNVVSHRMFKTTSRSCVPCFYIVMG